MKYYYTYKTTNLTKRRYYIGQHSTQNLNDGYYGSSKELKKDVENGDKYNVEILEFFDNKEDLAIAEQTLIKENNAVRDLGYYNHSDGLATMKTYQNTRKNTPKDLWKSELIKMKCPHCEEENWNIILRKWHFNSCKNRVI